MRRLILVCLASSSLAGVAPAIAQSPAVVGDWSGTSVGSDGVRRYAMTLNADDTFIAVLALPNGTTQRVWGRFRTKRITSLETSITFTSQGWRPLQVCVKESNMIARCSPYTPVLPSGVSSAALSVTPPTLRFASPTSFQLGDMTWNRDSSHPLLLNQVVPEHLTLNSLRGQLTPGSPVVKKYGLRP